MRALAPAALVLLALALPANAAAATGTFCGNAAFDGTSPLRFTMDDIVGAGIYNVRAVIAPCSAARKVVRGVFDADPSPCTKYDADGTPVGDKPRCRVYRYDCRRTRLGTELSRYVCRQDGGRIIRWRFGS